MESQYTVTLLRKGFHSRSSDGSVQRKCTSILVNGPAGTILVNPGCVWDGSSLISALKKAGVQYPEKAVSCVICTNGLAENVGCLSLFTCADLIFVGYEIQKRGDLFIEHDFGSGAPYEFDDKLSVVGTPGQRGHQVSVMVRGHLKSNIGDETGNEEMCKIAITGNLFMDKTDASRVCFLDTLEGSHGDSNQEKENFISCWRRSRQYILDRADWIIPAYGEAFKVHPEYSSTPCVQLA